MPPSRRTIHLLIVAAALMPSRGLPSDLLESGEASGFFALRPQSPGRLPFLSPRFLGGDVLEPGRNRWRTDLSYANTLQYTRGVIASERPDPNLDYILWYMNEVNYWTGMTLYYFDGETTRLDVGWYRGMPGGWELGLEIPLVDHGGGTLDADITRFHRNVGLSDAGRDSAPDGAGAMVLITGDGRYVLRGGDLPSSEPGDLTVSARWELPGRTAWFRAEVGGLLELPTGDPETLAGSGGIDAGLSFTLRWTFARQRLRFGAGYVHLGGLDAIPDLEVSDTVTASVAYEVRLGSRASVLMQLLESTSPYASLGVDGLSDPAAVFAIGPRIAMGRNWILDLALLEDPFRHNADLDVGLLMSLEWVPGDASRSAARRPPPAASPGHDRSPTRRR